VTRPPARRARAGAHLFLRIIFDGGERIGPGKIELLEAVERERSISGAARAMAMSYRRAWLLIDALNKLFAEPVVVARPGRVSGGSAELTAFGRRVVGLYRDAEARAARDCAPAMRALVKARRT
jgi:molybdate transport system regulatory protein